MISAIVGRRPAEAERATRRHLRSVITALNATRGEGCGGMRGVGMRG